LAYYLSGQYDEAVASFQRALTTGSPSSKTYNNLALAYIKLERYADAFEAFKQGSAEPQAYNNLGVVYLEMGKPGQAAVCFEKALESSPRHYAGASENLALARAELNRRAPSSAQAAQTLTCP
jgi:Flp pilus assembly protein TadD